ncbi:hypothetical protein SAMN05518672_1011353 [Chitinophaga sp. CF118]|uniref:hypothetical protein n=1 Tax=Chitinophaga sp. CF118 TaxID=1884367 RepID=UPI0008F0D7D2|nr:hypothetical protein [Chitinophaga sp. CF118]SFD26588.1 hypothetical protein SAMN05518672_1011353 [Chitinophaga sp. CF118]
MPALRKQMICFLMIFFFIHPSIAQSKEEMIKSVRTEFQAINSDTTLKKVMLENEDFLGTMTDAGSLLTGFYKDRKIRKIVQWVGLSNGIEVREYYFKDGKVIFVYAEFKSFPYDEKLGGLNYMKTEITFEGRYYFNNDKLFDSVVAGASELASENDGAARILLNEAYDDLRLLKKKK